MSYFSPLKRVQNTLKGSFIYLIKSCENMCQIAINKFKLESLQSLNIVLPPPLSIYYYLFVKIEMYHSLNKVREVYFPNQFTILCDENSDPSYSSEILEGSLIVISTLISNHTKPFTM